MAGRFWEVVGGAEKGIIVRTGRDLKSAEHPHGRLAKGSIVVQLDLVGDRLRYTLLDGQGPIDGWVSLKLKEASLLTLVDRSAPTVASATPTKKGKLVWLMPQGSRGDVQPLVALGIGLQQAGYAVRILGSKEQEAFVKSFDMQYTCQGPDAKDTLLQEAQRLTKEGAAEKGKAELEKLTGNVIKQLWYGKAVLQESARVIVELLATEVPDLVITTHLNYAAALLPWRLHRAPTLEVDLCGVNQAMESDEHIMTEVYEEMQQSAAIIADAIGTNPLEGVDAAGFLKYRRRHCYAALSRVILPPDLSKEILDMCLGFLVIKPAMLVRDMVPFGGAETLLKMQTFLDEDPSRPPVYLGFGSMLLPAETLLKFIGVFKATNLRAIVCKGWGDLSLASFVKCVSKFFQKDEMGLAKYASDEKNVLFVDSCPHEWIFPRCLCTIHHGGAGTLCAALRSGVPTMITPVAVDQFRNAAVVVGLGVGCQYDLMAPSLMDPALNKAIATVTKDETTRSKARSLGEKLRLEDAIGNFLEIVDREVLAPAGTNEGVPGYR